MQEEQAIEANLYPRVTYEMMAKYIKSPVSIVGKYSSSNGSVMILEVAPNKTIKVQKIDDLTINNECYLEIRGVVKDKDTIEMEDANFFGENLDLETFNKMVEVYHNPNYSSMTIGN